MAGVRADLLVVPPTTRCGSPFDGMSAHWSGIFKFAVQNRDGVGEYNSKFRSMLPAEVATAVLSMTWHSCSPYRTLFRHRNQRAMQINAMNTELTTFSHTFYVTHYPLR